MARITRRFTPDERQAIVSKYLSGKFTAENLDREYGIRSGTTAALLEREAGGPRPSGTRTLTLRLPLSIPTWAYLAGIFDGEGWVGNNASPRNGYNVVIVTTDPDLANFLLNIGGRLYWQKPRNPRHRVRASWRLQRILDVQIFLRGTLPYLTVKRRVAKEVLSHLDQVLGPTFIPLTP